ncbi:MAG: D-glycero-beta-D-manno-heptose-1,7-bisphosphate 7-phosphatase [Candidatus Omnitrophica bacterium ADurb.Bin314]|jgi:D-glycero-D-manno-heptose 1,7-bisphosphate phosphatase|nr:MAG: D-glycero-beta-D-manno-heptose-1,7-bisphosphate 7-phosphatase [Candidatus Omnitrophica bacterium ADurb.Bin314]
MKKIVFIDRDGVINVDIWKYVEYWHEFKFEPSAIKAMKSLTDAGFDIYIISNQAGVGDGIFTAEQLRDVHENMVAELAKHGVRIKGAHYCVHSRHANCACRKPKTGLLEKAVEGVTFDRGRTFFIGDKTGDIEAGKNFKVKTILVRTGYGAESEKKITKDLIPDHIVDDLGEAARVVLMSGDPAARDTANEA